MFYTTISILICLPREMIVLRVNECMYEYSYFMILMYYWILLLERIT